jgi:predicted permease
VVQGRDFTPADDEKAPKVAIVNEAMAKRFWPGESAVGKRVRRAESNTEYQVVGVTRTAQYMAVGEEPRPFFYMPFAQHYRPSMMIQLHSTGDPLALAQPVREIVRNLDQNVPLFDVRSMREHLSSGRALMTVRFGAIFGGVFGLLALVLAAVGLYGIVAYSVSNRTREIGIRIALGARMTSVLALVVRQGIVLCVLGLVAGLAAALALTRVLASILYDVDPADPLTFGAVIVTLIIVALVASLLPAQRAARIDPATALRSE